MAEALVEEGTLKNGDIVVAGTTYARIRNLEDSNRQPIKTAGPSTPVIISGFRALPDFGDEFRVVKTEKEARNEATAAKINRQENIGKSDLSSSELIRIINRTNELTELNILVKADVKGSLVSVIDSLKTLDNEEVAIRVVGSGIGAVTENDIHLAHTSGAIIYGFNVTMDTSIKRLAARDKVSVRLFTVIYELIDDAKVELSQLLAPQVVENILGSLTVKGVFKLTKSDAICGGEVTQGKLTVPALARVKRGDNVIAEAQAVNLKRGPQDAKEILEGEMCGVSLKTSGRVDIQEGDIIEFYTQETVSRTL